MSNKINTNIVWNVAADFRMMEKSIVDAYKAGDVASIDEGFAGLLNVEVLKGYNPDGSDRWVVSFA